MHHTAICLCCVLTTEFGYKNKLNGIEHLSDHAADFLNISAHLGGGVTNIKTSKTTVFLGGAAHRGESTRQDIEQKPWLQIQ